MEALLEKVYSHKGPILEVTSILINKLLTILSLNIDWILFDQTLNIDFSLVKSKTHVLTNAVKYQLESIGSHNWLPAIGCSIKHLNRSTTLKVPKLNNINQKSVTSKSLSAGIFKLRYYIKLIYFSSILGFLTKRCSFLSCGKLEWTIKVTIVSFICIVRLQILPYSRN